MTTDTVGKRLFVGVRVSIQTANALAQCAETLARRVRDAGLDIKWVAPANFHVTLRFLGWTRDETVGALRDSITTVVAGVAPFTFRAARLGGFPSLDKASVLWAGVENSPALADLAKRIETAVTALGFPAEPRPFHAHVTLGRLRETRAIRDVVLPMSEQMFSDTRVNDAIIFESETKSSGSVYRELHRISFKQPSNASETTPERQTAAVDVGDETDDGWPRGHGGF